MSKLPTQREMENAFRRRDESYDGLFYLAVRSTGIFCKPSCPARKPRVENVEYFATPREALSAGYRPCLRCKPMAANGKPPAWVKRLLTTLERDPSQRIRDADLRAMDIDPARARRYFRKAYGMTFQAYQRTRRVGMALTHMHNGANATSAGLRHGFDSSSGFRDAFERVFGNAPSRANGAQCIVATHLETPLGPMIAAACDEGVCMLEFADRRGLEAQTATLRRRLNRTVVPGEHRHLKQLRRELAEYFAGERQAFDVPIFTPGTEFQESVWKHLRTIPFGRTLSYEKLARQVGRPGAQRAVGRANGDNRLAIIIPCHRVVRRSGELGGYGGGLWRKQWLLDHERSVIGETLPIERPIRSTESNRNARSSTTRTAKAR